MFQHAIRIPIDSAAVAIARGAGIPAFEFSLSATDTPDGFNLASELAGTTNSLRFPARMSLSDQFLTDCAELYRALDSQTLVIHAPMFEKFGPQLSTLNPSIRFAVENGPMNLARLSTWAEQHPGLTLDVEHFWKFCMADCRLDEMLLQLTNFWQVFGAKVRQVHLPGYKPGSDVHRPMHANRELTQRVLTMLRDNNFNGLVVSEIGDEFFCHEMLTMDAMLVEAWSRGIAVSV